MSEEIKVSGEAQVCAESEVQMFLKAKEGDDIPMGHHVQLLLNQQIQLACLNWKHRDAVLQTKIAALEAEVVELRIKNGELSRKVGFLGAHWNIPPELKTKLEGEILKITTALNSTKGEK